MHPRKHNQGGTVHYASDQCILLARPPGACVIDIPHGMHFLDVDLSKSPGTFVAPDKDLRSVPSGYVFIPANSARQVRLTRSGWSIQLAFRDDAGEFLRQSSLAGKGDAEATCGTDEDLIAIARQLAGAWMQTRKTPSASLCQAVASLLCHRIGTLLEHGDQDISHAATISRRIQAALDSIEADLRSAHTLEDLASAAGVSPYHFARVFRAETGRSPHQYLLERRVAQARRLLRTTDDPIAAIAHDCGFGSQSHMNDVFRKLLDTTPGQLRRRA